MIHSNFDKWMNRDFNKTAIRSIPIKFSSSSYHFSLKQFEFNVQKITNRRERNWWGDTLIQSCHKLMNKMAKDRAFLRPPPGGSGGCSPRPPGAAHGDVSHDDLCSGNSSSSSPPSSALARLSCRLAFFSGFKRSILPGDEWKTTATTSSVRFFNSIKIFLIQ